MWNDNDNSILIQKVQLIACTSLSQHWLAFIYVQTCVPRTLQIFRCSRHTSSLQVLQIILLASRPLPYVWHTVHSFHSSLFHYYNIICWRIQITKYYTTQIFPSTFYVHFLRSNHSPQHAVLSYHSSESGSCVYKCHNSCSITSSNKIILSKLTATLLLKKFPKFINLTFIV